MEDDKQAINAGTPIRVVVVDDHLLVRQGLVALLCMLPGVEVAGQAGDADGTSLLVASARPDIVLIDIATQRFSSLECTAGIRAEHATVSVVMLSTQQGEEYVQRALQAGATGYVLKDGGVGELESALRAVAGGHICPGRRRRVVRNTGRSTPDLRRRP